MAHTTVSRALNDHPRISVETKARVRATAANLGYVTHAGARLMRKGSSNLAGLVVPDVQNEFYATAASIMADQCALRGLQLVLSISNDDPSREEQQLRSLREGRAAGVLIVPSPAPTTNAVSLLRGLPIVQFLRSNPKLGAHSVFADDIAGIHQATTHLVELGHRRIAFVGGTTNISTGLDGLNGYEAALRDSGIGRETGLIHIGPARPEFGYGALETLLENVPAVTAVVVASSRQILGLLCAAQTRGVSIPHDLSVVGYGDADWFTITRRALTAVELPICDMSMQAMTTLFNLLDGKKEQRSEFRYQTRLRVRASTSVPPARRRARQRGSE
jgi:LacI family transcriptional regulator